MTSLLENEEGENAITNCGELEGFGLMNLYQWKSKILFLGLPSVLVEIKYALKGEAFIPLASS